MQSDERWLLDNAGTQVKYVAAELWVNVILDKPVRRPSQLTGAQKSFP